MVRSLGEGTENKLLMTFKIRKAKSPREKKRYRHNAQGPLLAMLATT
jgi:hypothetical protein